MASKSEEGLDPIVQCVVAYRQQSIQAKLNRMEQNKQNLDCYHLRQDWSHKKPGQSKEFLAKQATATEQFVSFLQQGLIDKGNWFAIEKEPGVVEKDITAADIFKLTKKQLEKAKYYTQFSDTLKAAALQSLLILKVHGKYVPKISYEVEQKWTMGGRKPTLLRKEKMVWQLVLDIVRAEDYHPDPTNRDLYTCEDIEMDLHDLKAIAENDPDHVYDMEVINQLEAGGDATQDAIKSQETGQNLPTEQARRKRVNITECWGTLLNTDGTVLMENAVCAIANGRYLIRPARPNKLWHQKKPYVDAPIIRVPFAKWPKALMDAPTKHNTALNEIYNLMLDAGMQSVFGIRQIREHWLEDTAQVADGIPFGTTLRVNAACPPGAKAMERVDTSTEFTEATNIFHLTDREFTASAFSNDFRTGNLPERNVKATEIVASNQAITGVFNGLVKTIEEFIAEVLQLSWLTTAQHANDFGSDEMKSLLGEETANKIANLSPEERFAQTALGNNFKVFGLSTTLNKINDFKKITALLQTLATDPSLMAAFASKYDVTKLLGEIIKSLDLDVDKLLLDVGGGQGPGVIPANTGAGMPPNLQAVLAGGGFGAQAAPGTPGSNQQSQVPQANANVRKVETGMNAQRSQMNSGGVTTPNG